MVWPFKSKTDRLREQTMTTKTVVVPVKNTHYHEIVDKTVRIYNRQTGLVAECDNCADPAAKALELLAEYNGDA